MRSNFFSSGFGDFGNFGNFGNFGGSGNYGGRGTSRQVQTETRPDGTVVTTIIENGKKTTTVQKPSSGTGNNKKVTGVSNQNFNDFFNDNDWGFDIAKRFGFGNVDNEEESNNNNNNNNRKTYNITINNNNNNNSNKKYVTIGNIYNDYEDTGNNNNNKFSYDFDDNNNKKISYEYEEINNDNQINLTPASGNDFQKEALEQHNIYRRKHHVNDLVLSEELNQIAQNYANKLAATNSFQHSNNSLSNGEPLGENLFMCYGMKINGKTMSTDWYNEVQNYNYNGDYQSGKGHFTQLVWKGTKQVGFGYAQSRDGSYYGVANYYPAGNYMGEFRRNVLKP